jgi:hypothetical protein
MTAVKESAKRQNMSEAGLKNLVVAKLLTPAEYKELTGKEYVA